MPVVVAHIFAPVAAKLFLATIAGVFEPELDKDL